MRPSRRSLHGRLAGADFSLGQHDPDRPAGLVDDHAVLDLVLDLAQGMRARGSAANAQFRLLGHFDLGQQGARRRIPARKLDAGCFADQAASSIAPDEVLRPDALAIGQLDVHAGVVLREPRDLGAVVDRDPEFGDPAGEDAFDVSLPQPEAVRMAGGKVADVQADHAEPSDLGHLPLRKEAVGDPALIENLDRARLQAACARAGEVLIRAPLDDGDIDSGQCQLARKHQPRRTAAGDHHGMLGHRHAVSHQPNRRGWPPRGQSPSTAAPPAMPRDVECRRGTWR